MGFFRKVVKKIGRGIKKLGKKIGKAFKSVLKPFAKVFGKLGPIGSMAMMMIMPGIGQLLAGFGTTMGGAVGTAIKFVGNAINYVASAPKKIFSTITNGLGAGFDALTNASTAEGGNWFSRFGEEFTNSWNKRDVNSVFKFDVSAAGQQRLLNIADKQGNLMGYDDSVQYALDTGKLDDFAGGGSGTLPEGKTLAETMRDQKTTPTTADIPKPEASPGVAGKVKDFGKGLGNTEIPVLGRVGDVASVGQTTMSTMSTLGGLGSEEEQVGSSGDFAYQASEVLGPTTDQGGLYNITPPSWSYDTNLSVAQNNMNAQSSWNNSYGFPQGFDPYATPGYGFSYEQWLREQMAA